MDTNNHKIVDYDAVLDAFLMPSSARKVLPNVQEPKRLPTRSILVRYFRMHAKRLR